MRCSAWATASGLTEYLAITAFLPAAMVITRRGREERRAGLGDAGSSERAGDLSRSGLRAVVVGAGVAGLACANDVVAAGATVRVREAGDAVGGRMRTDRQSGFLLDRGFQVFNTSYPQVRRRIDLRA